MRTPPLVSVPISPSLQNLCASVQSAQLNAAQALLRELAASVAGANGALADLPPELRAGHPDHYSRHVAYADPHGSFTIAYLIWRPGQFSPVHGHKTWCTYRVLQGELTESHYRWDPELGLALRTGAVARRPGDIVTATPAWRRSTGWATPATRLPFPAHLWRGPERYRHRRQPRRAGSRATPALGAAVSSRG